MSFRTAYNDRNRNRNNSNRGLNRELFRDKTAEEEKRDMNAYYKRMRNWTPSNGRK